MPRHGCQPHQPPQTFSTFNFVDVKNIEVSLAKRTPSNTCQSQSLVPSTAAEDSPVILSVTASSSRWKHMQTTAAGCRKISQLWSRKWRTTAASLELRRCSHYWWQSDGKEQSLVSATLPPTKCHLQSRRRENVFPRTGQTLGWSNAISQGSWASTTVSKSHSERGQPWCLWRATLTARTTVRETARRKNKERKEQEQARNSAKGRGKTPNSEKKKKKRLSLSNRNQFPEKNNGGSANHCPLPPGQYQQVEYSILDQY